MEKIKNTKAKKGYPGMIVPNRFFADFQTEMERKIDRYEAGGNVRHTVGRRSKRSLSIGRRIMLWSSVAACTSLLIGLFPFMRSVVDDGEMNGGPMAAEATAADWQFQEVQDMMLATVSDYDIYMNYYYEE